MPVGVSTSYRIANLDLLQYTYSNARAVGPSPILLVGSHSTILSRLQHLRDPPLALLASEELYFTRLLDLQCMHLDEIDTP